MLRLLSCPVNKVASNHGSVDANVSPDRSAFVSAAVAVPAALTCWFNFEMVVFQAT